MPGPTPTHFERLIRYVQQMTLWRKGLLVLVLLGLPYSLAYFEGIHTHLPGGGNWRIAYFPTIIIVYVFATAPWIWQAEKDVVRGLCPLVPGEQNPFTVLTHNRWWRSSLGDWVAFGVGLLGGTTLLFTSASLPDLRYWATLYWFATTLIMHGALAWAIYAALGSARLTAILHSHIHHEDPFDLAPFEPVGRQGLILSMIFVGGITISLLFVFTGALFLDWQSMVVYSILVLMTVLIFFTVIWPTHRILWRVKQQKLAGIRRLISQSFRKMETLAAEGEGTQAVFTELEGWLTLEQRLKQVRTWPYDVETLRTLFLSVLTPLFIALVRDVGIRLLEGYF